MKKSALLIFNMIPEVVDFYILPEDIHEKYKHLLVQANDKYINGEEEENDGMKFLNAALCHDPESIVFLGNGGLGYLGEFAQCVGIFQQYKVSNDPFVPFHFDGGTVYISGFIL